MSDPKKAASSEQDPTAFRVCELGSIEWLFMRCKLSTAPVNGVKEKRLNSRERAGRGTAGDRFLEGFTARPFIGEINKKQFNSRERRENGGYGSGWARSK